MSNLQIITKKLSNLPNITKKLSNLQKITQKFRNVLFFDTKIASICKKSLKISVIYRFLTQKLRQFAKKFCVGERYLEHFRGSKGPTF